jgi:hypothetical protein
MVPTHAEVIEHFRLIAESVDRCRAWERHLA